MVYSSINSKSDTNQLVLVTGPARSGKSEWAETLASSTELPVTYVATASVQADDREWRERILKHQQRRSTTWRTIEAPISLAAVISANTGGECLLVDSLGTWLANLLEQDDARWQETAIALLTALAQAEGTIILVAEETGWGVVPAYPLGRTFRDRLGMLTRDVGAIANVVYLVTGGHVLNLSQLGTPLATRSRTP